MYIYCVVKYLGLSSFNLTAKGNIMTRFLGHVQMHVQQISLKVGIYAWDRQQIFFRVVMPRHVSPAHHYSHIIIVENITPIFLVEPISSSSC